MKVRIPKNWTANTAKNSTEIKCCICGKTISVVDGNNPYPVREYSAWGSNKNRCCHSCNKEFVIPFRMVIGRQTETEEQHTHTILKSYSHRELIELKNLIFEKEIA